MTQTDLTQPIKPSDIAAGRLRVPASAKHLFPPVSARVHVELAGTTMECRWEPRMGPDRERSGVIGIGKALSGSLTLGEQLPVSRVYRVG
jgi:hypothetical protein